MAAYYASHAANGPGRWLGRGADALGIIGQAADPEQFRRGILGLRRRRRAGPDPRSAFIRRAPSRRSRSPPRSASSPPSEGSPQPTCSRPAGRPRSGRLSGAADKFTTTPAPSVAKLGRASGIDPATLYGTERAHQLRRRLAPSARPPAGPAAVPQQVLGLSAMGFGFGSEVPWDCAPFARRRKLG